MKIFPQAKIKVGNKHLGGSCPCHWY